MKCDCLNTPIGKLVILAEGGYIKRILFEDEQPNNPCFAGEISQAVPVLQLAKQQLSEYFAGKRKVFSLPLNPKGGAFHKKVWDCMMDKVAYATTASYSQVADMVGNPKASRAVGMANNRNPIPIIIPCHRIVGKGGGLVGFRWGVSIKDWLLEFEKNHNKIV